MVGTMRLTAMVVFILIGSRVFSMVFQGVDGAKWVEHMLTGLPGGQVGFLIVVNIFIFFLAFFLDFFEIAFIILPMLGPVADKLGIDLVWFGVLLCVNMQTSLHAPAVRLRAVLPARHRRHAVQGKAHPQTGASPTTSTWAPSPGC
jgi:TRAP-type mannitol/chloroaromatic compound transport system permease large subunit